MATVRPDVTDAELRRLHEAGVRGVRFNFVRRLVDAAPREALEAVARRVAPLGWHVVLYFEAADLPDLESFFASLPVPLVVDHMGRPDVTRSADGPEFARFLRFVAANDVWVKVSCPERLTVSGPPALDGERHAYRDVVPFARKVVEEFTDRALWGTDWPHPNLKNHMPDDGLLVDHIPHIATTAARQRALLVDNPCVCTGPKRPADVTPGPVRRVHPFPGACSAAHPYHQRGEPAGPAADHEVPQADHPRGGVRLLLRVRGHQHLRHHGPGGARAVGRRREPRRVRHLAVLRGHVRRRGRGRMGWPTGWAANRR